MVSIVRVSPQCGQGASLAYAATAVRSLHATHPRSHSNQSLLVAALGPQDFSFVQNFGEVGLPRHYLSTVQNDIRAAASEKVRTSSSVYIAALDMPHFVNEVWPTVPHSHRVVLVTAQEVGCLTGLWRIVRTSSSLFPRWCVRQDIGVPTELWKGSARPVSPSVWNGTVCPLRGHSGLTGDVLNASIPVGRWLQFHTLVGGFFN